MKFHVLPKKETTRRSKAVAGCRGRRVLRKQLVNTLNHINFQDGEIIVNFKHRTTNDLLSLPAKPQPCLDRHLDCCWAEGAAPGDVLSGYQFESFYFTDGLQQILVEADLLEVDRENLRFSLPNVSYDVSSREIKRHQCRGISARVSQGEVVLQGRLSSFSAFSFSVVTDSRIDEAVPLDEKRPMDVTLSKDSRVLYSGQCELIRRASRSPGRLALRPLVAMINRYRPKTVRSLREELSPLPNIVFHHPFTGKKMNLRTIDISATGFSVEEGHNNAMLIPGITIDDVSLEFMNGFAISCRAQVLYNSSHGKDSLKSGLAVVEMDSRDHLRLYSFLQECRDRNISIGGTNVDLEGLWNFFFQAGFIYPQKYAFFREQKEDFKSLYRRLYTGNPGMARHIIYQNRGRIYGHISMYRFYRLTWIVHHHAALSQGHRSEGLELIKQILRYAGEFHYLNPSRMQYISCYYRQKNKFPHRVFGGAAAALGDPRKCSIESYAYLHYSPGEERSSLPGEWSLEKAGRADLEELRTFYQEYSGGLLMEALDFQAGVQGDLELDREYRRMGFRRERRLYALREGAALRAVLAVNLSDIGLNMSDLTNCVQAFVLDEERLPAKRLRQAFSVLSDEYGEGEFPVMIYPASYTEKEGIACEKLYDQTILDLEYLCPYLYYMEELTPASERRRHGSP